MTTARDEQSRDVHAHGRWYCIGQRPLRTILWRTGLQHLLESLMTSKLIRIRAHAALAQSHRCIYCRMPIWEKDSKQFMRQFDLTHREAELLRCTAEHLQAKQDGGRDSRSNIAAACWYCNSRRHQAHAPLDPDDFAAHVQRRVNKGAWLPGSLATRLQAHINASSSPQSPNLGKRLQNRQQLN